jgi:hypothetical protein
MALIEGKIAQILSDKFVIINVGARDGVRPGMRFAVLFQGDEVKDPGSGEVLGRWEVPKGFLSASHVQERLATCEGAVAPAPEGQDASTQVLSAAMIDASMRPEIWGGGGGKLNVNRTQFRGAPQVGPISIGDTVREVAAAK